MFGARWRLFRAFGIPIYLDLSWLIILALLTYTVAEFLPQIIGQYYHGVRYPTGTYWWVALLTAVGFFICIVLHELGHAITARHRDIPTKGITLFLFGGVAELGDEPPSAWSEFLMAAAGPAVTVVLMVTLGILATVGYHSDWSPMLVAALGYLAEINAVVLVFNLIPAFPLDGGRVLRSILWGITGDLRRATRWASWGGIGFSWLMIAGGIYLFIGGHWWNGGWLMFIGWFLGNAARASYAQVLMTQALRGELVRRFMTPNPITVPATLGLREWVEEYVYRYHRKVFPVVADGRLAGYVDASDLAELPRSEWDIRTVADEVHKDVETIAIRPDAEAVTALKRMQQTGLSRLFVVDGGQLIGVLSLRDLLNYLSLKMEIENEGPPRRTTVENSRKVDEATPYPDTSVSSQQEGK